jgi:hypothetical protein
LQPLEGFSRTRPCPGPQVRELLMLLLMAFWQEDVKFLADVVLMIAGEDQRADLDLGDDSRAGPGGPRLR